MHQIFRQPRAMHVSETKNYNLRALDLIHQAIYREDDTLADRQGLFYRGCHKANLSMDPVLCPHSRFLDALR